MVGGINVFTLISQNGLGGGLAHAKPSVLIHYALWQPDNAYQVSQQTLSYAPCNAWGFLIVTASCYWSSSPNANNNNKAWGVNFSRGNDNNNNKTNSYRARLVRSREWILQSVTALWVNATTRHLSPIGVGGG